MRVDCIIINIIIIIIIIIIFGPLTKSEDFERQMMSWSDYVGA